jgi:hypothetical protein
MPNSIPRHPIARADLAEELFFLQPSRESCEAATTRRESTPELRPHGWHPSIVLDPELRQKTAA